MGLIKRTEILSKNSKKKLKIFRIFKITGGVNEIRINRLWGQRNGLS